jgi:3-hydroxyisobutyrate dehydrogenase-like beta-hydroxyacid dehydrogenase
MLGYPEDGPLASRLLAVASTMGKPERIIFCGGLGTGLAAKIANNYSAAVHLVCAVEAMNIGIRNGVDKKILYRVLHESTGQSFMADMVCPAPGTVPHAPSSNGWRLGFKTELFPKDMGLALDIAHDTGASTILGQPVFDLFKAAGEDPRCRVRRFKSF